MFNQRQCYLINVETNKQINLPHLTPTVLGRNEDTEIKDTFVSKKQILLYSDIKENKVKLKVVGKALSGCNGLALQSNLVYTIGHHDIIELRIGNHKFKVIFDPEPESDKTESEVKKRKIMYDIFKKGETNMESAQELNTVGMWEDINNKEMLIYTPGNCEGRNKIAGFDIDGTIIKTKSGARFPTNMDDWTWYLGDVKNQLRKVYEEKYKVVFFTNQFGLRNDNTKIKDFKKKIENILKSLNLPVQVFIAIGKKHFRKPRTGMWDCLLNKKNNDISIDINQSFFVGDAAGREKNWAPKRNKDHSCADRLFAMNIGLKFYTPEEYFLKQKPVPFKMPEFDPRIDTSNLMYPDVSYPKQHVVLMVGGPGSGKSNFVKGSLIPKGYIHISRDQLGSWQKCVKEMEDALAQKKNVVIDNTNVDKETRSRFIQVAKKLNVDTRCFVMDVTVTQMRHNNLFRELTDPSHAVISDIIIFSYRKNYQEPELSEGYVDILKIPFIAKFSNKNHEKLYRNFLLD
ncbi:polynucleotide kinase 3'-phosphatase [Rhynchophorus ferrugineus]|uniref:polynucleotide kinase 3'-phosphatase n=1 Tax=Rhynchophorus ferrugineus TaxID=354439 RepID=UPI003FCE5CB9